MGSSKRTWEAQQFDQQPALRQQIADSAAFRAWVAGLPSIEIDGDTLYLAWGDVPMDADQVAYVWARDEGLLEPEPPTGTTRATRKNG